MVHSEHVCTMRTNVYAHESRTLNKYAESTGKILLSAFGITKYGNVGFHPGNTSNPVSQSRVSASPPLPAVFPWAASYSLQYLWCCSHPNQTVGAEGGGGENGKINSKEQRGV